jgi:hypothetical protein
MLYDLYNEDSFNVIWDEYVYSVRWVGQACGGRARGRVGQGQHRRCWGAIEAAQQAFKGSCEHVSSVAAVPLGARGRVQR